MRTSSVTDALFPRTRHRILAALLLHPDRRWYLRELANHLQLSPSSLQRELGRLVLSDILVQHREGKHVYLQANRESPIFPELRGLMEKTAGAQDVLAKMLAPLESKVAAAFIYGSLARGDEHASSDIDLFIVGEVGLAELSPLLRKAEQRVLRPINPMVYSPNEFAEKLRSRDHFVTAVMNSEKLFVRGNENDLAQVGIRKQSSRTRHQRSRSSQSS